MKKAIPYIILNLSLLFFSFTLTYVAESFILNKWDTTMWSQDNRMVLILIAAGITCTGLPLNEFIEDK